MKLCHPRRTARKGTSVLAVMTMTLAASVLSIGQASADHGTIDRAAFGVSADGLVDIAPTPNCPESTTFGECDRELVGVDEPPLVTTGVLNARTVGTHDPLRADSFASVADVVIGAGQGPEGAAVVTANLVTSSCTATEQGLTGATTLAEARVLGQPIPIPTDLTEPAPNTIVVDNEAVFVIVNEQIITDDGNQITVNAIRVVLFPGTELEQEVIIASTQCSIHAAPAPAPAGFGYLEICKKADNSAGRVTGKFTFRFAGKSRTIPVGTCTAPVRVPAGDLTVTEVRKDGVRMSGCATRPVARLLNCDPANRQAVVRIVRGGVAKETVLTITNRRIVVGDNKGAVKVCKIAGSGVKVGTTFGFTVGGRHVSVPAGPASQGGYCKIVGGFDRGSAVKVTEAARSGIHVSRITVRPVDRKISVNKAQRTATVRIGRGNTVVAFTNTRN